MRQGINEGAVWFRRGDIEMYRGYGVGVLLVATSLLAACQTLDPPGTPCEAVRRAKVSLDCRIGPDASLSDCRVLEDSAPGCGFGDTALQSVLRGELAGVVQSRRPNGRATLVVRFTLED